MLTITAAALQPRHPPGLDLGLLKITQGTRQQEAGEDAVEPRVS
jgi:hypothetical protein